jgi:hypothetical protein
MAPEQKASAPPPPPPKKPSSSPRLDEPAAPIVQDLVLPSVASEYRHALPIKLSMRVLRWLVPICLILVFLLTFFPWVGAYPGGIGILTQNGWGTAFGGWGIDSTIEKLPSAQFPIDIKADAPGASALMIIYVILMCLIVLASAAIIVFNLLPPASVPFFASFKSWQGAILGGAALVAFLFLGIEMLKGFNLPNSIANRMDKIVKEGEKQGEAPAAVKAIMIGMLKDAFHVRNTFWFRLVVLCNLLAIIGGALEFWMGRRGHKPPPKLEFSW